MRTGVSLAILILSFAWAVQGAAFEINIDLNPDSLQVLESGSTGRNQDLNARGLLELDRGRMEEAKSFFEQAISASPESFDAINNLGVVFSRQGRESEAMALWKKIAGKQPKYAPAAYNLALSFYGRGNLDSAFFWIDKAYSRNLDSAPIALLKGLISYQSRHMAEAALAFEQAIKAQPQNGEAYAYLALTYKEMGYADKASKALESGVRKTGNNALLLQLAAKERYDNGRYAEALSLLEKADAANARIAYFKGLCAYELGCTERAETYFRAAIQADSSSSEVWLSLGNALYGQKKWKDAETAFRRAVLLDPNDVGLASNLASALFAQGQYRQALVAWKALEERTEDPLVFKAIGKTHFVLKEWKEALPYFERTMTIRKDYETMDLLAICRFRLGRVMEARGLWNELRRNAGGSYSSSEVFFNDFNSQDDIRNALDSYKKTKTSDPDETFYKAVKVSRLYSLLGESEKAIATIEPFASRQFSIVLPLLSAYHRQSGDLQLALARLEALEKRQPDYRRIKAMKGDLLTELGRYGEALAALRAERNPDALTYYQIGYCLDEFGRLRESEDAFRKSAEMDPNTAAPKALLAYVIRKQDSTRSAEARSFWTQAAKLDSGNAEVASNIGLTYYENGDYENALLFAQRAANLAPKQAGLKVQLGNVLFKLKRNDEALVQYRAVIMEKGPHRCGALGNIAAVHMAMNKWEAAVSELRPYVEACDSLLEPMFVSLRRLKQYDRAAFYFSKISEQRRRSANLYQVAGEISYEHKEYDRAIADLGQASDGPAKHFYMTQCFLKKNNAGSAIEHARRFKETAPKEEQYEADMLLGLSYMAARDFSKAIESFQNGSLREQKNAKGPMNLAIAYFHAGQYDKGRGMYDKSIALNPDCWPANSPVAKFYREGGQAPPSFSSVLDRDSLYNRAVELHQEGTLDSAEALYLRVLSLDSSMASAWSNLGLIYQAGDNTKQAELALGKAVLKDSLLAEGYYNLSWFLWNKERKDEALQVLKQGLLHNPDSDELLKLQKALREKPKKSKPK